MLLYVYAAAFLSRDVDLISSDSKRSIKIAFRPIVFLCANSVHIGSYVVCFVSLKLDGCDELTLFKSFRC